MKSVIFDMDGVIFDSERVSLRCWIDVGKRFGLPEEKVDRAVHLLIGTNDAETRRIFLEELKDYPLEYETYHASVMRSFREARKNMPLKPGAREVLHMLKKDGFQIGLATSSNRVDVMEEVRESGIISCFDEIVCGNEVKRSKPEPDIFLVCCEHLHALPDTTFVIEDSYNGIRAAHAAGMRPIMIPDLLPPTEEMENLSEAILRNLMEAFSYIAGTGFIGGAHG